MLSLTINDSISNVAGAKERSNEVLKTSPWNKTHNHRIATLPLTLMLALMIMCWMLGVLKQIFLFQL